MRVMKYMKIKKFSKLVEDKQSYDSKTYPASPDFLGLFENIFY